jgi:DNA-binding MarR family transcriptional regulator
MTEFERSLNNVLVDTFNYILKYEEASLKSISSVPVTVTEAHILEAIGNNGGSCTVSEIAATLGTAVSTATVAVKKLERKGLVSKVPCPQDGRRLNITLTDLGRKIDRAHGIFHTRMVRHISGGFTGEEKDVLLSAVKKLSAFFKEKIEEKK